MQVPVQVPAVLKIDTSTPDYPWENGYLHPRVNIPAGFPMGKLAGTHRYHSVIVSPNVKQWVFMW